MLNEYELAQAAADRARYAPADPCATPPVEAAPEPDLKVVSVDALRSVIDRCERAMQKIYLGPAEMGLDDVYIDVAVAWSHARHMLRGTRPNAGQPLSDLEPAPVSQETTPGLTLVERSTIRTDALIERGETA